ncbi:HTH-type transcriptional repressor GamR [Thermoflexales bacterium]|nr:HTH-type transcriptional repressor GamR [Thermoflexales bacterium]
MPTHSSTPVKDTAPPKHAQLRETLRHQIETLPPDQKIPSEHELCAQHGVSRITVRKALADLVHEGLLYAVQGKGTFVAPRKFRIEWAQEMAGFHADMARRGLAVKVRVLEQAIVPATQRVAEELNLQRGDPVVKIVRLRLVDEQPFDIATNYTPWVAFPGLEKEDLTRGSIYTLIRTKYNVQIDHGVRLVEAVACPPDDARLLHVRAGAPLLLIHNTMCDVHDRPMEYSIIKRRGDRAQIEIAVVTANTPL